MKCKGVRRNISKESKHYADWYIGETCYYYHSSADGHGGYVRIGSKKNER